MEDYGLSARGTANVAAIFPKISNAVAEREENPCIDMGTSENWLLRNELVQFYKRAVEDSFSARHLSYSTGFAGDPDLLEALAQFFNTYFKPCIPVQKGDLATAPGAAYSLDGLLYNICEPGDGLLIPTPCWNGFDWLLNVRSGVQPVFTQLESFDDAFTPRLVQTLEKSIYESPHPIKGLLLTNPHNPFGKCYPKSLIIEILKFCSKHRIHFISDEIYALSRFSSPDIPTPEPFVSVLQLDVAALDCDLSHVHTIWSVSKDLGSSGLRMGCCISQQNKPLVTGLALVSNTQMSSLTAIAVTHLLTSQELPGLLALNSQRLADAYAKVTSMLKRRGIQYIPGNMGPFLFARLAPYASKDDEEAEFVIGCKAAGVNISPGRGYHVPEGEKGWARINFALQEDQLAEGLQRLAAVLDHSLKTHEGGTNVLLG
ncbi:putative ACC synthase [Daldinia loculata]|uniref:putative ACC synthase n=1 Tax=Daldinia loculata TaxID=103429 RepID=UPI0020C4E52C|nr:putative ACC synthase [Daldinia loculata]KAI1647341.1 putative ACC synthase [Daldinia loculata]